MKKGGRRGRFKVMTALAPAADVIYNNFWANEADCNSCGDSHQDPSEKGDGGSGRNAGAAIPSSPSPHSSEKDTPNSRLNSKKARTTTSATDGSIAANTTTETTNPTTSRIKPSKMVHRLPGLRPLSAEEYQALKERFETVIPASTCHDPQFDLPLLGRLVEMMGVKAELSLVAAMSVRFGASKAEIQSGVKLVLEAVRLLHLCRYPNSDIELIVAHASVYLQSLLDQQTRGVGTPEGAPKMELMEIAHIFVLMVYLAHSFVEDETCPIKIWHQRLFLKYCDFATLNKALMQLMQRLAFALRVSEEELEKRLAFLKDDLAAAQESSTVVVAA